MMKPGMLVLLTLLLSACSLTPALTLPTAPVPARYPPAQGTDISADVGQLDWRMMFPDPRLQRLIELALLNNRDLRLAALNIQAVQVQYGMQHAAQHPSVEAASGSARPAWMASRMPGIDSRAWVS